MTPPIFDLPAYLHSLTDIVLVIPAVLGIIVLRAALLWRLDRRADAFADKCRSVDVDTWRSRRAA